MLTIDPNKVVEYGPPAVQQLGKLADACIKHWKDAPQAVRLELGNAVALLNKVVTETGDDNGDSNKNLGTSAAAPADHPGPNPRGPVHTGGSASG